MTCPFKSVRVGPFDVAIDTLTGEERDRCFGTFSETTLTILLREKFQNDQQMAETLLHELLHAIFCVGGVKPKDPEERIISQTSTVMASVIRDNPNLMRWLQEKLSCGLGTPSTSKSKRR